MRREGGVLTGPLIVSEELEFSGVSPYAINVKQGGLLHLFGICSGNLVIEVGGRALIFGMVTGVVVNRGHIEIHGTLEHEVLNEGGAVKVLPGSVIAGHRW